MPLKNDVMTFFGRQSGPIIAYYGLVHYVFLFRLHLIYVLSSDVLFLVVFRRWLVFHEVTPCEVGVPYSQSVILFF